MTPGPLFTAGERETSSRAVQTCMLKITMLFCIHEKQKKMLGDLTGYCFPNIILD